MTYYRAERPRSLLWIVLGLLAFWAGVFYAGHAWLNARDRDVRRAALEQVQTAITFTLTRERNTWARERDSLASLVGQRDTVLRTQIVRVATLVHDTVTPPAVAYPRCLASLDTLAQSCEQYRATASATIAVGDSLHRADSLRVRILGARVTASADSLHRVAAQRDSRVAWPVCTGSGILAALVAYVVGRFSP